jgi:hypothetical protein
MGSFDLRQHTDARHDNAGARAQVLAQVIGVRKRAQSEQIDRHTQ